MIPELQQLVINYLNNSNIFLKIVNYVLINKIDNIINTKFDKHIINELNSLFNKSINFSLINRQIIVNIDSFYIIKKDDVFKLLLYLINSNLLYDGSDINGTMYTNISQFNLFLLNQKSNFRIIKYSTKVEKIFEQNNYTVFYQIVQVDSYCNYSNNKIDKY